jgi:hypothetical protein
VLAELEMLTPGQLAAIEECHRVNIRRLKKRSVLSWKGGLVVVFPVIGYLAAAVEKIVGVKPDDLWPLITKAVLTGATFGSNFFTLLYGLAMFFIFLLINIRTFQPALNRAYAFEDLLTIAKAYRKGLGDPTKPSTEPSTEPSLTATA